MPLEKEEGEEERNEEAAFQDEPQTGQDEPEAKQMNMGEKDPQGMGRKVSIKADEEMSDEGIPEEKKIKKQRTLRHPVPRTLTYCGIPGEQSRNRHS